MSRWPREAAILEYYRRYLQEGMTAFDIGANIGTHSIPMGLCVGRSGHVYSFEPDPDNLALLRENIKLNLLDEVITIVPKAVSAESGSSRFWRDLASGATGTLKPQDENFGYHLWYGLPRCISTVQTVTIDDFMRIESSTPDLIKIDVEGAELDVITGMHDLLTTSRPDIIVDTPTPSVVELLRGHGYIICDLLDNCRCISEEEDMPKAIVARKVFST